MTLQQVKSYPIKTGNHSFTQMCERCNLFKKLCNDYRQNKPHLYTIDFDCSESAD